MDFSSEDKSSSNWVEEERFNFRDIFILEL